MRRKGGEPARQGVSSGVRRDPRGHHGVGLGILGLQDYRSLPSDACRRNSRGRTIGFERELSDDRVPRSLEQGDGLFLPQDSRGRRRSGRRRFGVTRCLIRHARQRKHSSFRWKGYVQCGLNAVSAGKVSWRDRHRNGLKDEFTDYLDQVNWRKPKGELPFKYLPMLVRFRDPNDPTSVERVDPLDLASSFGPGVTLKSAFVEITDDPLTRGIEARFPWVTRNNFPPMLIPPPPGPGRCRKPLSLKCFVTTTSGDASHDRRHCRDANGVRALNSTRTDSIRAAFRLP